jgi:hypothetical protein
MSTTSSFCFFHQQCLMTPAFAIHMGTSWLHIYSAWTLHVLFNCNLWPSNDYFCEYRISIIFSSYDHHEVSLCLPSTMCFMTSAFAIHMGTNQVHIYTAWTLHSSFNCNLWSSNENICEYGMYIIVYSYAHHELSFCLPSTMFDDIYLYNTYRDKLGIYISSLDTWFIA